MQLCSEETTLGSNIKHTSKLCDVINRFYFVATVYIHAVTRMCRICHHIKDLRAELLSSFLRKQCRVNTSYATECHHHGKFLRQHALASFVFIPAIVFSAHIILVIYRSQPLLYQY